MAMDIVDPAAEVEKAMHGKVTGLIIPPPEIRAVVDKTAEFVAKNGKNFEEKILTTKDKKFNFMKVHDPYHAYYEFKIREFEEGGPQTALPPVQPTREETAQAAVVQDQPAMEIGRASCRERVL